MWKLLEIFAKVPIGANQALMLKNCKDELSALREAIKITEAENQVLKIRIIGLEKKLAQILINHDRPLQAIMD